MKFFRNDLTKIVVASLIFPAVLFLFPLVIHVHKASATSLWQAAADLVIFLIALGLNYFYFKQRVSWFNDRNLFEQLMTAMPAIIIIGLLDYPVLFEADFQVKIRAIVICLLVGLAEEYVFRGLLIALFLKLTQNRAFLTVVVSSLIFGLIHVTNLKALPIGYVSVQVIFAAAIGILFGTIYLKTKNLTLVIVLHALRDMFPMFSNKLMGQMGQTQFSMAILYIMVIFLLITLVIARSQLKNFVVKK
ncbi:lysostaphin resistance A-like protein [Companilactobacillus sp. FL22-1]|uniref:CPBP family intramembrane glutamic endopeptidase n=1 Tax=Companilactobacillus sp. FL22-1 TaxID=3373892 RepID=UPI00375462B3